MTLRKGITFYGNHFTGEIYEGKVNFSKFMHSTLKNDFTLPFHSTEDIDSVIEELHQIKSQMEKETIHDLESNVDGLAKVYPTSITIIDNCGYKHVYEDLLEVDVKNRSVRKGDLIGKFKGELKYSVTKIESNKINF